jgi:hypothetical protein
MDYSPPGLLAQALRGCLFRASAAVQASLAVQDNGSQAEAGTIYQNQYQRDTQISATQFQGNW